jgi:hypothetical protein
MSVGKLADGTKGFDCNERVVRSVAEKFRIAGYKFAVRYVRRDIRHEYDISLQEAAGLLASGLSLMLVQHVAPPGWLPTAQLGRKYGQIAAIEAQGVAYPAGATLWCDLEEVGSTATARDVIAFCNAWYDVTRVAGYEPGLYVGYHCGLSSRQLYRDLRFARYWSAYNLNREDYPATRGVQMRQKPYPAQRGRVIGVPFEYDVDVIQADAKGGLPTLWLPDFDV